MICKIVGHKFQLFATEQEFPSLNFRYRFLCGRCGSTEVRALSGERLEVTTMEVELDGDGQRTGATDRW